MCAWMESKGTALPEVKSQVRTVPSIAPLASRELSLLQARAAIESKCAGKVVSVSPVLASRIVTALLLIATANLLPSGLQARLSPKYFEPNVPLKNVVGVPLATSHITMLLSLSALASFVPSGFQATCAAPMPPGVCQVATD